MKGTRKYSFYEKPSPVGGRMSAAMAVVSFVLLCLNVAVSYHARGNAGIAAGAIGWITLLFSGYGFAAGLLSFREKNATLRLPILGSIGCGLILIIHLALLLAGSGAGA